MDTLSFQLSIHHLDDKRTCQLPFAFSFSEPFDLDFAGRPRSTPKRSRSLPNPVASKHREKRQRAKDENHNDAIAHGPARPRFGAEKTGFRVYSQRNVHPTTAHKHHTSPLHEYANACSNKEDEDTSDEELSAVAATFRERAFDQDGRSLDEFGRSGPPAQRCANASGADRTQTPRVRKRVSEEDDASDHSAKRSRPTVNFEKMLSSAVSFFKPILHTESMYSVKRSADHV